MPRCLGRILAMVVVTATALTGCTTSGSPDAATEATEAPVVLTVTPDDGASDVDPLAPVSVQATDGTLVSVTLTNEQGRTIPGITTPDQTSWKPGEPLGYGRTYTVEAVADNAAGATATRTSTFTTLRPRNQTKVYLTTTGGAALTDGGTYGVGTVVVAHFDEPLADRATAERRLRVSTEPAVEGSWYWIDDQNAHWRPRDYLQSGSRVTVEALLYGVRLGDDLYGQEDTRTSFTIGPSHISIADDTTKQVVVYENGTVVRTMPTSMGMGGSETVNGQTISFWTQPGIYTVMDKANPVIMGFLHLWPADQFSPRIQGIDRLRHAHQHRRNLPAPTGLDRLGAGQHQRVPRLSQPQRRQRPLVLRVLQSRRRRGDPQHRRRPARGVAERRLECFLGPMAGRKRPSVTSDSPTHRLLNYYLS